MPVDGLGSDAGRQTLTEVGVAGARASRKLGAARALPAPLPPAVAPQVSSPVPPAVSAPHRASPSPASARGERLVALSALAVLAIAALFFVERIGGMRGVPAAPPVVPPALEAPSMPVDPAGAPAQFDSGNLPGPASRAAPAPAPRVARAQSRPRSTPLASTRKPHGKSIARAEPPATPAPFMVASAEPWQAKDPERSRWERMDEEVAACAGHGSFLDAVVCDQRARHRYCDEWWGRSDACPSGRTADYGN
jgi:hypothetical protein